MTASVSVAGYAKYLYQLLHVVCGPCHGGVHHAMSHTLLLSYVLTGVSQFKIALVKV
jgi:hypothetical protein